MRYGHPNSGLSVPAAWDIEPERDPMGAPSIRGLAGCLPGTDLPTPESPGCTLLVPITGGLFWGTTSHLPAQPPPSDHQVPSPPSSTCLHIGLDSAGSFTGTTAPSHASHPPLGRWAEAEPSQTPSQVPPLTMASRGQKRAGPGAHPACCVSPSRQVPAHLGQPGLFSPNMEARNPYSAGLDRRDLESRAHLLAQSGSLAPGGMGSCRASPPGLGPLGIGAGERQALHVRPAYGPHRH